jgi:uncharacterized protein YkwD
MMIRVTFLLCLFVISISAGRITEEQDYYSGYTYSNFRTDKRYSEMLDLAHPDLPRLQAVLFFLTNETRVKHNLPPLVYSRELEETAHMHAEDMVKHHFFSHMNTKTNGKYSPNDRAKLNKISNPFLAENIIEGYGLQYTSKRTVYLRGKGNFSYKPDGEFLKPHTYLSLGESLITGWMNSKEHRKNILSGEALQLGCGIYFYNDPEFNDMPSCKAVQDFQWYHLVQ